MDTIIQVSIRHVFGKDKVYPLNAQATRLAMLAGTKTLTRGTLDIAEAMGFELQLQLGTTLTKMRAEIVN
jgi:hypothetical protein